MRRKTIAGRLYFLGGSALLSVAALAAGTIYFAVGTRHTADTLYRSAIVKAVEAGELEASLDKHRRLIGTALLEVDPEHRKTANELKERIERLVDRASDEFSSVIKAKLPVLWTSADHVLRLAEGAAPKAATAIAERYVAQSEGILNLTRQYRRTRVDDARLAARTMSSRAGIALHWLAGVAMLALLLIGPLGFVLLRGMISRLGHVTVAMQRIARHDTNVNVEALAHADEIGEMADAICAFKQHAVQLRQLNRWLDIALESMTRGIAIFGTDERLVVCNSVYARLYDLPGVLAQPGAAFSDIVRHGAKRVVSVDRSGGSSSEGLASELRNVVEPRANGESRQRLRNGRTVEVSLKSLSCGGWVSLHEDITDRLTEAERIARLVRQDALTGVANRLHFQEGLEEAIAGLGADGSFALLAIDLDRFKEVNDTLGHPAGDALLMIAGHRLSTLVRGNDMVARLGGDEFAIIQRDVLGRSDADALARRVVDVLRQPFLVHGKHVAVGATVGIALAPRDGPTAEEVMRKADIALHRAKAAGRSTWQFYDPEVEAGMRVRRELGSDLAGAACRGELELFYQPIVSLASRRVEGCEALIRWWHPARGMVSPAAFIPIAEETGLICEIGAWALDEACRVAATWPLELSVAVNLSVAQFTGPDLVLVTAEALDRSGLSADRLVLEVTETLLLGDDPATFQLLHRLRDLGVAIALDDFGTGYSSLSHLRGFPFDKIKIDQSFVKDLPQRRNCEAIVGAVARLASSLDMTTVAEGVETEDHLARVKAAGCDAVQGYLFSRPVPAKDLAGVVAEIDQRFASGSIMAA